MDMTTAVVCVVAIISISGLIVLALLRKGDVKAGGKLGDSSFFIEAKDRKGSRRESSS
jgi:preprotein translocase subunit SecG